MRNELCDQKPNPYLDFDQCVKCPVFSGQCYAKVVANMGLDIMEGRDPWDTNKPLKEDKNERYNSIG